VDGEVFPITTCDLTFALNQLPVVQVRPAVGRDFHNPDDFRDLSTTLSGKPAEIILDDGKGERRVFAGYVDTVQGTDSGDMFSRRREALMTLRHRASILSGAPAASMTFIRTGNLEDDFMEATQKASLFGVKQTDDAAVSPVAGFLNSLEEGDLFIPGSVLQKATGQLMVEYLNVIGETSLEEILRPFPGASLRGTDVSKYEVAGKCAAYFAASGFTGNIWQSLVRAATEFYLMLVPYSDGVWIANPSAYLREPDVTLTANDVISIRAQQTSNIFPVHGVYMQVSRTISDAADPIVAGGMTYWPRDEKGLAMKGRMYHQKQFPDWMTGLVTDINNPVKPPAEAAGERSTLKPGRVLPDIRDLIFGAVKTEFAAANLAAQLTVATNYREDLHPGTRVAIDVSNIEGVSFLGNILHGLIVSTRHSISNAQGSAAYTTTLEIAGVRSDTDNNRDEYTWVDEPLYDEVWTGCLLDGTLLQEST